MKIRYLFCIVISIVSLLSVGSLPQEQKMKKSEWKELMELYRLRKESLIKEREFLSDYLNSLKDIDSLLQELENCKKYKNLK